MPSSPKEYKPLIAGNIQVPYISRIVIFADCMIKATPTQVLLQLVGYEVYASCLCGHRVYKGLWTKEKDTEVATVQESSGTNNISPCSWSLYN